MVFAIQKEVNFNLSCYVMARTNILQAKACMKAVVTSILASFTGKSMSLKDRCTNFAKASGLLVRAPLLCIPFVNRATQLALRLLSPKSLLSDLDSYPLHEIKIRYSNEMLFQLIKEAMLKKNEDGSRVDKSYASSLSEKYQLNYQDLLKILDSSQEIQCSRPLKKEVNQYSRSKCD